MEQPYTKFGDRKNSPPPQLPTLNVTVGGNYWIIAFWVSVCATNHSFEDQVIKTSYIGPKASFLSKWVQKDPTHQLASGTFVENIKACVTSSRDCSSKNIRN